MSENTVPSATPQESSIPLTISEARQLYVQKNYEAYAPYFERFDKNQRRFKAAWSWWGFLATSGWLVYRKMYWPLLAYFIIFGLFSTVFSLDLFANMVMAIGGYDIDTMTQREFINLIRLLKFCHYMLILLLSGTIIGITGHWLYYQQVNRKIKKARKKSGDDRGKMSKILKEYGGLFGGPVVVALTVYLVLPICLSFVVGSFIMQVLN